MATTPKKTLHEQLAEADGNQRKIDQVLRESGLGVEDRKRIREEERERKNRDPKLPYQPRPGEPKLRGTILPYVKPADPAQMVAGDPAIQAQRALLRKRVETTKGKLGKHTKRLNQVVQYRLKNAEIVDNKLDPKSLKHVRTAIKRNTGPAVHRMAQEMRNQVRIAMRQSLLAQSMAMKRVGLPAMTPEQREAIVRKQMREWGSEKSPPGGRKTVAARIRDHKKKLRDKLTKQTEMRRNGEGKLDRIREGVRKVSDDRSPGRTLIDGGSTFKQMVRFSIAEQVRKSNDAAVMAMQRSGLVFGNWTLSPVHKWYGGREICEQYAAKHDASAEKELRSWGLDLSLVDLTGVYWLEKWPAFPHPYCQCSPNPWLPPALRKLMDEGMLLVYKVGEFPKELISGGSMKSTERESVAATFNAVASEIGLRPTISPELAGTLGNKGLAQALAVRIRATGKTAVILGNVKEALIGTMREAEQKLADFSVQVTAEKKRITGSRTLSEATKESLSAKRKEALTGAMIQYQANLLALRNIEDALINPQNTIVTQSVGKKEIAIRQVNEVLGLRPVDVRIQKKGGKHWIFIRESGLINILPAAEQANLEKQKQLRTVKDKGIKGGKEWQTAQKRYEDNKEKLEEEWKRISAKYDLKQARGVAKTTSRGVFRLAPAQAAGMEFIEQEKQVLLHFAPGLGKTPNVVASVSDLAAKKKISKALISPPAGVRVQFAQEIVRFNAKDRMTVYLPKSNMVSLVAEMKDAVVKDIMDGNKQWEAGDAILKNNEALVRARRAMRGQLQWKTGELSDFQRLLRESMEGKQFTSVELKLAGAILDDRLPNLRDKKVRAIYKSIHDKIVPRFASAEEEAAFRKLDAEARAKMEKTFERIDVKPVLRNQEAMREQMSKDKNLFTLIGHDDLAQNADHIKEHFDYIVIDEVHQLTSSDVIGGSAKAAALQKMQGGRIKYQVGLTGTASRNNIGEFWDIAEWLRPGHLPNKATFMAQYEPLTQESNLFSEAVIKMLRKDIDPFVFTMPSPVEVPLISFVNPKITAEQREQVFRDLKMTPFQNQRARDIENQFQMLKEASNKLREVWEQKAKKDIGWSRMGAAAKREASSEDGGILKKAIAKHRNVDEARLQTLKGAYEKELDKLGIKDRESPEAEKKLRQLGSKRRGALLELEEKMNTLKNTLTPESWRDNQHFINVHVGNSKENAKVKEVVRLMDEDLLNEKVIIHAERSKSIAILQQELEARGKKVLKFTGDMGGGAREASLKAFNAGEADVLILSRAGSTGLNVQKVSHNTIHFDTPLTYAEYVQREARNWRNGQEHAVHSYMLHNSDSAMDRRRLELFITKKKVLDALDEVTKVSDVGNPLDNLTRMNKAGVESMEHLRKTNTGPEVEAAIRALCAKFRMMDIVTSACVQYAKKK